MKIKPYVDKLSKSKEFSEFKKKYSDSYLIAGFFVLDFEGGANMHQIDYYIPSIKKVAAFTLDKGVTLQILDPVNSSKAPNELNLNTKIDLDALEGILHDEMRNRNMSEDIRKIIAVIQNVDGKNIWNLSCVLTGMEILKSHIDDNSKTILKIEKMSMVDLIKKLPLGEIASPQDASPKSKKEIEEEIKKLNAIEAEIEKEKEKLLKSSQSKKEDSQTKPKKCRKK